MEGRFVSKRNLAGWKMGKTSVYEAVAVRTKIRPYAGYSADVLLVLKPQNSHGPLLGFVEL